MSTHAGITAGVTVIPGVVFTAGLDGMLRAFATMDGRPLWQYDTTQEVQTVNGVKARGGSIGSAGTTIAEWHGLRHFGIHRISGRIAGEHFTRIRALGRRRNRYFAKRSAIESLAIDEVYRHASGLRGRRRRLLQTNHFERGDILDASPFQDALLAGHRNALRVDRRRRLRTRRQALDRWNCW